MIRIHSDSGNVQNIGVISRDPHLTTHINSIMAPDESDIEPPRSRPIAHRTRHKNKMRQTQLPVQSADPIEVID